MAQQNKHHVQIIETDINETLYKSQTAIDWFIEQLPVRLINQINQYSKDLETAKEIQRDQIEEAFELGQLNENSFQHTGRRIHKDKEEYYNTTYNK
jgi:hypothetical protein